jgi:hypothetical protein
VISVRPALPVRCESGSEWSLIGKPPGAHFSNAFGRGNLDADKPEAYQSLPRFDN